MIPGGLVESHDVVDDWGAMRSSRRGKSRAKRIECDIALRTRFEWRFE